MKITQIIIALLITIHSNNVGMKMVRKVIILIWQVGSEGKGEIGKFKALLADSK